MSVSQRRWEFTKKPTQQSDTKLALDKQLLTLYFLLKLVLLSYLGWKVILSFLYPLHKHFLIQYENTTCKWLYPCVIIKCYSYKWFLIRNPLTSRNNEHIISSYNIHTSSSKQVLRILKPIVVIILIWYQILVSTNYKKMCNN